jgi:hypothetical protein
MACTITSLFLFAMLGIIAVATAFRPASKETPPVRRHEAAPAPSGDRVIA